MLTHKDTIITWLINQAEQQFGAGTGPLKKAWVVNQIDALFEQIDDKIPYVGKYLDMPGIDNVELLIISDLVEEVFKSLPQTQPQT